MKHSLIISPAAALLACVLTSASAQEVQKFNWDDLYYVEGKSFNGTLMCGFQVRGNHRTHDDPHVEWDINIDEIITADATAVGVSAGTFNVVQKTRLRTGRSAITVITFSIDHDEKAIEAHIFGQPNRDNAICGALDSDEGRKLFVAIADAKTITISVTYADNSSELLRFQYPQDRHIGAKNTYLEKCKRGEMEHPRNLRIVP